MHFWAIHLIIAIFCQSLAQKFLWTLSFKIGKFQWTFSEGEFSWTLLVHENSFSWVNFCGFCRFSKHSSVSGQGCRCKAPARVSKHCSVSRLGLGQVCLRLGLDLGQVWVRFGLGLGQVRFGFGLGLGQVWVRFGLGLGQVIALLSKKCPRKFTKNVHEKPPKMSARSHLFCPRKVTFYVHEKSATQISSNYNETNHKL